MNECRQPYLISLLKDILMIWVSRKKTRFNLRTCRFCCTAKWKTRAGLSSGQSREKIIFPISRPTSSPGMALDSVTSGGFQVTPGFEWLGGILRGTGIFRSTRCTWRTRESTSVRCSQGIPRSPSGQKLLASKCEHLAPDQLLLDRPQWN